MNQIILFNYDEMKSGINKPIKNKELLQMIMEAFSNNEMEFVLSHLADDVSWNIVGMPVIRGKREFLEALKTMELENFTSVNIKNIIAEGNYVVVESVRKTGTKTMTLNNPSYCDIYCITDGKIREITTYAVDTSNE